MRGKVANAADLTCQLMKDREGDAQAVKGTRSADSWSAGLQQALHALTLDQVHRV